MSLLPRFPSAAWAVLCPSLLAWAVPALHAQDWDVIKASYTEIEWVAGLSGESPDNGNEWNNADGKPAREAELSEPHSAMADMAGAIYIADKNAHAIRKITPDGIIHTVAGTNAAGYNGDGVATACQLDGPQHAYVLPNGVFYIMDTGNRRIRKVGLDGQMKTIITETQGLSRGLWVSRDESVIYYATDHILKKWTPARGGGPGAVLAQNIEEAGNLDVAANGDIYISDRGASLVYRVPANNSASAPLVAVAGVGGNASNGPNASGRPALEIGMREARGVAFHPAGGYFVATHRGGDVWYVDVQGRAWMFVEGDANATFFPDPQPVPTTEQVMSEPRSVSVALNGDILICGNDAGYIRRIRYTGPAASSPTALSVAHQSPAKVSWRGEAKRWFSLEAADALGGGWSPVLTGQHTGAPQEWTDAASPAPTQRFYRLREFRDWPN